MTDKTEKEVVKKTSKRWYFPAQNGRPAQSIEATSQEEAKKKYGSKLKTGNPKDND